jgi:perosamine synthetase
MMSLLPTEYWEHRLVDALKSMWAAALWDNSGRAVEIPRLGDCLPVRSARAAIVVALRALDLPEMARIGVPLYCCPVVFKAIIRAGYKPCFIDIDSQTLCLSAADLRAKQSNVDAVVAVHMFGNVCDMGGILEVAGKKPVIEDCAQSLGSMIQDRMTGSFGNIGVFSFRTGKYLSVGEGGALFTAHGAVRSLLAREIARMPTTTLAQELEHVGLTYIRSLLRSRPLYGILGHLLWNSYNRRVGFSEKTPIVLGRIFRADQWLTEVRLSRISSAIRRQRDNAEFYYRTLNVAESMLCREMPGTFFNRYLFPIVFPSSECRDHVARQLNQQGIGCLKPYSDITAVAAVHYGYMGDCPTAERVAKGVLAIPNHHGLRAKDVNHVATVLNEILRSGDLA